MAKKKRKSKARSKKAAASTTRKKRGARRKKASANRGVSGLSLADLQRMVAEREREVSRLQDRRQALLAEVAAVDAEIAAHVGKGAARAPRGVTARGGRGASSGAKVSGSMRGQLPELIQQVLHEAGEAMRLRDIADAVQAAGYATKSSKFGVIVGQRLAEMGDSVKKVGRGLYTLK